jgi:hypothetical protein
MILAGRWPRGQMSCLNHRHGPCWGVHPWVFRFRMEQSYVLCALMHKAFLGHQAAVTICNKYPHSSPRSGTHSPEFPVKRVVPGACRSGVKAYPGAPVTLRLCALAHSAWRMGGNNRRRSWQLPGHDQVIRKFREWIRLRWFQGDRIPTSFREVNANILTAFFCLSSNGSKFAFSRAPEAAAGRVPACGILAGIH